MRRILNRYKWNIAAWTVVVLAVAFVLVQTDLNPPRYLWWVFFDTGANADQVHHPLPVSHGAGNGRLLYDQDSQGSK